MFLFMLLQGVNLRAMLSATRMSRVFTRPVPLPNPVGQVGCVRHPTASDSPLLLQPLTSGALPIAGLAALGGSRIGIAPSISVADDKISRDKSIGPLVSCW